MPKMDEAYMAERRAQILDAAQACFVGKGVHPTSVNDICREAGLSVGGLYRHFKSKQEIVDGLFERSDAMNDEVFVELREGRRSVSQTTAELLRRFQMQGALEVIRMSLVMQAEAMRDDSVKAALARQLEFVRSSFSVAITELQRRGDVPEHVDPDAVATILIALFEGLKTQLAFEPGVVSPKLSTALAALLGGLFGESS